MADGAAKQVLSVEELVRLQRELLTRIDRPDSPDLMISGQISLGEDREPMMFPELCPCDNHLIWTKKQKDGCYHPERSRLVQCTREGVDWVNCGEGKRMALQLYDRGRKLKLHMPIPLPHFTGGDDKALWYVYCRILCSK